MKQFLVFLSLGGAALYTLLVITDNLIPNGPMVESRSTQRRLSVWGPYLPYRSLFQARQARLTTRPSPRQQNAAFAPRASQIGGDAEREPVERAKVVFTAWAHSEASVTSTDTSIELRAVSRLISSPASMPPMIEPEASGMQNVAVRSHDPQTVTFPRDDDNQIGKRPASLPITGDTLEPLEGEEAIWFVVSRAARLHAGPSVSSPITHFYPVGTELKLIGYAHGWFQVSDPATLRQGWIYEKYYLEAIRGPGHPRVVVQESLSPTRVAFAAPKPKPASRVKKPRSQQKIIKSRTQQHKKILIASARIQNESVANLVEKAFRGY